jgi:tRNA (cytidine/uridine-2'-O-)-methyltransferase
MSLHIVLFQPEIPQNTGNIVRLCHGNGLRLHLIEPLGFRLDESKVKRAGLDHWFRLKPRIYREWSHFLAEHPAAEGDAAFFFTAREGRVYWDVPFPEEAYLIFGPESDGFPGWFRDLVRLSERAVRIPMANPEGRSLNLANAAAVAAYEAMRQRAYTR